MSVGLGRVAIWRKRRKPAAASADKKGKTRRIRYLIRLQKFRAYGEMSVMGRAG
jgi:hypothetical protein